MDEIGSGKKPIIEGLVKFRDGKKWKSRWCTLKKLSPVADYIHFQLYREKDYRKGNLPKASLALSDYVGCESGFTLDKESHTLALLCKNAPSVIIAFSGPEELLQWKTRATRVLHTGRYWRWPGHLIASGQNSGIKPKAISVHMRTSDFCIVSGLPPKILAVWRLEDLRKYGIVNGLVCFEGGSNCGKMSGKWVLKIDKPENFMKNLEMIKYSIERGLATTSFEKQLPDISSLTSDVFQSRNDVNDEWIGHNEKNKDFLRKKDQSEKTLKYSSFINKWGPLVSPSFSQCTADSFTETERSTDMDRMSLFSQSSMLSDDSTCKSYFTGDDNLTSNRFHYNLHRNCYSYSCHSNKLASVYGNYDVPKSPSTIFQVHNKSNVNSLYDKPNKISRCLITNSTNCNCYQKILADGKTSFITFKAQPNNTQNNPSINDQSNIKSVSDNNTLLEDTTDIYADLKLFESSEAILRNAGFSEEEIKNIDDSKVSSTASEEAKLPRTINSTETIEKEEKVQEYNKSYSENISLNLKPLGETCTTVCTQVCSKCSDNNESDKASNQCVKIRRSSSVPNKCLKNRESSSSSDSGISTGSLKPNTCNANHRRVLKKNNFQLNSKFSARMHLPAVKSREISDQIDNITFRFDKMHERGNLCLTKMIDASDFVCETDYKSLRILSLPELIPDVSNMNSLEFSENSTRCTSRPRSGKEYLVLHPV